MLYLGRNLEADVILPTLVLKKAWTKWCELMHIRYSISEICVYMWITLLCQQGNVILRQLHIEKPFNKKIIPSVIDDLLKRNAFLEMVKKKRNKINF